MYRAMRPRLIATIALFAAILGVAGCGSGGSEDDEPAVTFTPETLTHEYGYAQPTSFGAIVYATHPKDFQNKTIYAYVIDTQGVITPQVIVVLQDEKSAKVTFTPAAKLAVGVHQGSFQIRLCKDQQCNSELRGSPVSVPYKLTVLNLPMQATLQGTTAFTARAGSTTNSVSTLVGGNACCLPWTATVNASWLTVSPSSSDRFEQMTVRASPIGLAVGSYTGALTLKSELDTKTVTFTMTITP